MSTLNFDANAVEPSASLDPIPVGKYPAVITDSEMKSTKSGNGKYLELTFEVIDGEYRGRKVWARLNLENPSSAAVEIARAELSAICRAVKAMQIRDSVELHNLPLVISVRCRKNAETGELSNEIKGYEPREAVHAVGGTSRPATGTGAPPWARQAQ